MAAALPTTNEVYTVVAPPHGLPDIKSTWAVSTSPIPEIKDGELLVQSLYISVDPYLRGRMREAKAGDNMVSGNVSAVVASKSADYKEGDVIFAYLPWAKYNVVNTAAAKEYKMRKVNPSWGPASTALGVLGMPGMTAYVGLLFAAGVKPGETVVVSGAAGAVGTIVGQIAKIKGCRVVGTVGSADKVEYITQKLGFDVGINYNDHKDIATMRKALSEACPKGIDVYFDNTGGHVTDAVFDLTNKFARVAVCGQISMYNATEVPMCPQFLMKTIYKSVNIRGFMVYDYEDKAPEFFAEVSKWVAEGKIKYDETIVEGFDKLPEAFLGLFSGSNVGKMVVKI